MRNCTLVTVFFGCIILILELFFINLSNAANFERNEKRSAYTIIIDPGHGGDDTGSIGHKSPKLKHNKPIYEKDITLTLALKVRYQLNKYKKTLGIPLHIVLTRTQDTTISLDARTIFARQFNPDLFLSIHVNAETTGTARGFETYFLNNTSENTDRHLEKLNRRQTPLSSNLSPDLALLLRSVASDAMVSDSRHAAEIIQDNVATQTLNDGLGLEDRGIRQSVLQVLLDARVPAVLFETAFLSNKQDLEILTNRAALDSIAKGIAAGVIQFLQFDR